MQNICLTLQYDGTRYLGWSRPEKDGANKTISNKISELLTKLTGEHITLYAGAKTDPGVHALSQTVSFHTDSLISYNSLFYSLNQYLPQDIAVLKAEIVPERFRADLNPVSRTYEYRICTSRIYNIFTSLYEKHIFPAPDTEAMKKAAAFLLGQHDFRPFTPARKKKGTNRNLFDIRFEESTAKLSIFMTADDFLYQMPAVIAGTLLETGLGLRTPESMKDIFSGSKKAGAPLDVKGLLLHSICY